MLLVLLVVVAVNESSNVAVLKLMLHDGEYFVIDAMRLN